MEELTDLMVADAGAVSALAWSLLRQRQRTDRGQLVIKGLGEWCTPRQIVTLQCQGVDRGQYVIERVAQSWRMTERQRDWRTTLDVRGY